MTLFNVQVRHEVQIHFFGIEANTLDGAARIAADKLNDDDILLSDCEGKTIAALVELASDAESNQSRLIDFEAGRSRKLATAIESLLTAAGDLDSAIDRVTGRFDDERAAVVAACRIVHAAIAGLREGISQPANSIEEKE